MLCGNLVYRGNGTVFPCGQCMACRVNTRRKKTCRLLLESVVTDGPTSFLTLTYRDEKLPLALDVDACPVPTLDPEHCRLFVRRCLRTAPRPFRYFTVGEYGNLTGRPHYHALFYGLDPVEAEALIRQHWHLDDGYRSEAREALTARFAYIAGYTAKKLTNPSDERLSGGQAPEFARQGKPAVGLGALPWLVQLHRSPGGDLLLREGADVAYSVRIGGKVWPLDRTIRLKLRSALGIRRSPLRPSSIGLPLPPLDIIKAARRAEQRQKRRARRVGEAF